MGLFNRMFRMAVPVIVVAGFSLVLAQAIMPPGQSLKDLPQVMAQIRERTPNPLAKKILDLILDDERAGEVAQSSPNGETPGSRERADRRVGDEFADRAMERRLGVGTGRVVDPRTLEAIDRMTVSDELKKQIKRNYLANGEVPGLRLAPRENPEAETREPAAARLGDSGSVWPTRSLQAVVAVTAGSFTGAARPPLPNAELEEQADTLLGKIHAEIVTEAVAPGSNPLRDRKLAEMTESVIKALGSAKRGEAGPGTKTE